MCRSSSLARVAQLWRWRVLAGGTPIHHLTRSPWLPQLDVQSRGNNHLPKWHPGEVKVNILSTFVFAKSKTWKPHTVVMKIAAHWSFYSTSDTLMNSSGGWGRKGALAKRVLIHTWGWAPSYYLYTFFNPRRTTPNFPTPTQTVNLIIVLGLLEQLLYQIHSRKVTWTQNILVWNRIFVGPY